MIQKATKFWVYNTTICVILLWFLLAQIQAVRLQSPPQDLRQLKYVFHLHLWAGFGNCIFCWARPCWADDVSERIWNPIGCRLFYGARDFIINIIFLSPIYFSYLKTKFYKIFSDSKWEYTILKYSVYILSATVFLFTPLASDNRPIINNGVKECWNAKNIDYAFLSSCVTCSMIQYIWMTTIFRRSYNGIELLTESIPEMKR